MAGGFHQPLRRETRRLRTPAGLLLDAVESSNRPGFRAGGDEAFIGVSRPGKRRLTRRRHIRLVILFGLLVLPVSIRPND